MTRCPTVAKALVELVRYPRQRLYEQWNWKAALFSSLWRAGIFFTANFSAGLAAAYGAMLAEFLYRAATAGFYGAITQQLSRARPRWLATVSALVVLPMLTHSMEFAIHRLRGTPNLSRSMTMSVAFTVLATLFNLHAMRRGVLIVGEGRRSLAADLAALPGIIGSFILSLPLALANCARRAQ